MAVIRSIFPVNIMFSLFDRISTITEAYRICQY